MLKIVFILTLLMFSALIFSQEEKVTREINSIAEELAAEENDEQLAEGYADQLRSLSEEPVRINTGDEKELSRLFFLTGFQVHMLSEYVNEHGPLLTVYEIAALPGFDRELAGMMLPFISLGSEKNTDDSPGIHQVFMTNVSVKPGSEPSEIHGSAFKLLSRYRFTAGKFSGGFTLEKDPGEKLFYGTPPLPDFLTAGITWSGKGFVKKVIAGDFSVRSGAGIVLNSSGFSSYSLSLPSNLSGRTEIRQYSSSDENNFFRGVAIDAGWKRNGLILFFSANMIDATLSDSAPGEESSVQSLYKTGLHNTAVLLAKKDVLKESSAGLLFTHAFARMNTGLTFFSDRFSLPFSGNDGSPENLYKFSRQAVFLSSAWYSYAARKFIFSGEGCIGGKGEKSIIQTVAFRPSDRLNLNTVMRYSSPGFVSFHGRSPVSGSVPGNEKGLSAGFSFEAARFLFISAGTDLRIYPWLRYRSSEPSMAVRNQVRIRYLPSDRLSMELLYSFRKSAADSSLETGMPLPAEHSTRSVRLELRYSPEGRITFTSRADLKNYSNPSEKGYCLSQDIAYKPQNSPFSFWVRYSVFSTDSFYSGIYMWENDLLWSYSVPVLYGKGFRLYTMIKVDTGKGVQLRLKYSFTSYAASAANSRNTGELKLQLVARL
jgi:hypothetical protein